MMRLAVLGATSAANLFGPEGPVGQRMRIGNVPFEVVGVLEAKGADAHGVDIEPESGDRYRPGDSRHMVADAGTLRGLGWRPEVDVCEGIRRYVEWIRALGDVAEQFSRAERRQRASGLVRDGRRAR